MQWWIRPGPSRAWAIAKPADVAVNDLTMAVLVGVAEGGQVANHLDPRRVERDENHAVAPVRIGLGVADAQDDRELAARVAGAGAPPLAAADHVLVAVAADAGGEIRRVAGGDVGFGHPEARSDLAVEERDEPALLLLGCAEVDEEFHVPGVRRRAVERLRGNMRAAAGDLRQGRVLEVAQARTPALVGEKQVPQPALAGPRLELLDDRRERMGIALPALLGVHRLGRVDVAVHEVEQFLPELLRAFGVREVHVSPFSWCRGFGAR
jgi:hypothetical protein